MTHRPLVRTYRTCCLMGFILATVMFKSSAVFTEFRCKAQPSNRVITCPILCCLGYDNLCLGLTKVSQNVVLRRNCAHVSSDDVEVLMTK